MSMVEDESYATLVSPIILVQPGSVKSEIDARPWSGSEVGIAEPGEHHSYRGRWKVAPGVCSIEATELAWPAGIG